MNGRNYAKLKLLNFFSNSHVKALEFKKEKLYVLKKNPIIK